MNAGNGCGGWNLPSIAMMDSEWGCLRLDSDNIVCLAADSILGIVDFAAALGPYEQRAAYLLTHLAFHAEAL